MSESYYMIITTPNDFAIDLKNKFKILGFPERNKKSVQKFKKGDKVVFYVLGEYLFGGIAEVTGEYFYDNKNQIWTDPYDKWPSRINAKEIFLIEKFEDMVFLKDIWNDLSFVKQQKKWGVYFQGSFKKLSKEDYTVIENALKERCNSIK